MQILELRLEFKRCRKIKLSSSSAAYITFYSHTPRRPPKNKKNSVGAKERRTVIIIKLSSARERERSPSRRKAAAVPPVEFTPAALFPRARALRASRKQVWLMSGLLTLLRLHVYTREEKAVLQEGKNCVTQLSFCCSFLRPEDRVLGDPTRLVIVRRGGEEERKQNGGAWFRRYFPVKIWIFRCFVGV